MKIFKIYTLARKNPDKIIKHTFEHQDCVAYEYEMFVPSRWDKNFFGIIVGDNWDYIYTPKSRKKLTNVQTKFSVMILRYFYNKEQRKKR